MSSQDSWGSFQALPNFRSYCKEMREHICTNCFFLSSQAGRDLETFPGHWGGSSSSSSSFQRSILRRRGFYVTAFLGHGVTPEAKVGSSLWPVPCFFVKLHQTSGFEFRAISRQLCWMEPLIIWEIYSSFSQLRRLEMRAPLFLLVLTPVVFGAGTMRRQWFSHAAT